MPEYSMMIENRAYRVGLVKKEGKGIFEARINDKTVELKLVRSDEKAISPFTLKVGEKIYHVELKNFERDTPFPVKINNVLFKVQLKELVKRMPFQTSAAPIMPVARQTRRALNQEGAIVAPMAGKIVSVAVGKGDAVKIGDVVCILEAMKMENEVIATKAGKIHEVNVSEGTPVNEGDILLTIK